MREVSESEGQAGFPWYHAFGNHDYNRKPREDRFADETFELLFGPSTYAFDYGAARFIVLRNTVFQAGEGKSRFPDDAVQFVRALLQHTSEDRLIVLLMHVPLRGVENAADILGPLSSFSNTLSIAGHTHTQSHVFLGLEYGWNNAVWHHQYIAGAVSGSWWCGERDETGIPHAVMNDGTPNGYAFLNVCGKQYSARWKCARRPADYQMNIYLPDDILAKDLSTTEVLVNFFAGSAGDHVDMQVSPAGRWTPMTATVGIDPECLRMHGMNAQRQNGVWGWDMDYPSRTNHLWKANLKDNLSPGTYTLTVRALDCFGTVFSGHRLFRVLDEPRPPEKP